MALTDKLTTKHDPKLDEALKANADKFKKAMDLNGDGSITENEQRAFRDIGKQLLANTERKDPKLTSADVANNKTIILSEQRDFATVSLIPEAQKDRKIGEIAGLLKEHFVGKGQDPKAANVQFDKYFDPNHPSSNLVAPAASKTSEKRER